MIDRTSRFAFVSACMVTPLAVAGSAFSLYRIAEGAGLALPLALPVALDLTALASAAQIRAHRHLVLAWVTLVAGVLGSAALQIADAWARGPIAWGVHGALPLAALVCFEYTVPTKEDRPEEPAKPKARRAAPAPPPPVRPAEVASDAEVTNIATARRAVEMSDEEIARAAAELLVAEEKSFSRRNWEAACKQVAGVGRVRAGQVRHLAPDTETGT